MGENYCTAQRERSGVRRQGQGQGEGEGKKKPRPTHLCCPEDKNEMNGAQSTLNVSYAGKRHFATEKGKTRIHEWRSVGCCRAAPLPLSTTARGELCIARLPQDGDRARFSLAAAVVLAVTLHEPQERRAVLMGRKSSLGFHTRHTVRSSPGERPSHDRQEEREKRRGSCPPRHFSRIRSILYARGRVVFR